MPIARLAALMPLGPFMAFAAITLGAHRWRQLSRAVSLVGVGIAALLAQLLLWSLVAKPSVHHPSLGAWYAVGTQRALLGLYLDLPAAALAATVTLVCLVVLVNQPMVPGDTRVGSRRYALSSLLVAAMLGAILCDHLLAFLVCWSLMNAATYLLTVGAGRVALRGALVVCTGQAMLVLGLALLDGQAGSLTYGDLLNPEVVTRLAGRASMIGLLLCAGALTPLGWLSATLKTSVLVATLVHTATLGPAGVFLLVRVQPLLGWPLSTTVAMVGAVVALYGAFAAGLQQDARRLLGLAMTSQLGFMVGVLGLGGSSATLMHLVVYTVFGTLHFLAAGSLAQGITRGHQYRRGHAVPADRPDLDFSPTYLLWLGGLAFRLPFTALAFFVGAVALVAIPLLAASSWPQEVWQLGRWAPGVVGMLALAVGLTAFYAVRQVFLLFLGAPRSRAATYARENRRSTPLLAGLTLLTAGLVLSWPLLRWALVATAGSSDSVVAWAFFLPSLALVFVGVVTAWWLYGRRSVGGPRPAADPLAPLVSRLDAASMLAADATRFVGRWGATLLAAVDVCDRVVVDGLVRGVGMLTRAVATLLSLLDDAQASGLDLCMARGWDVRLRRASAPATGFDRLADLHPVVKSLTTAFTIILLLVVLVVLYQG